MPASLLANPERVKEFLDKGGVTGARSPFWGLRQQAATWKRCDSCWSAASIPTQKDTGGRTVLMMAAAAFPPNPAAVRFVLELGGDIQARDDAGRTALDWALTLGETEIAGLLRKAGAKPGALSRSASEPG